MTKKEQKRLDYFAGIALHAIITKIPVAEMREDSSVDEKIEFHDAMRCTANGASLYAKYLLDALGES